MTNKKYLSIQYLILVLAPTIFSLAFPVWDDWAVLESFFGYISGFSGLLVAFFLGNILGASARDHDFFLILPILLKLTLMYFVYIKIIPNGDHERRSITINVILTMWNLLFGAWWMLLSQQ